MYIPYRNQSCSVMNVLYVITGLGVGGAEVVTINLANTFHSLGNKVGIVYLSGSNQHKEKINSGIKVWGLDMTKSFWGFVKAQILMRRILKEFSPDVVHAHMFHANVFMRCCRIHYAIAYLITTEHNKNIESRFRMWLYRVTDRLTNLNTNVLLEATDYFVRQGAFKRKNSIVMYNGIDLKKYTSFVTTKDLRKQMDMESDFIFLNVGRLTHAKDQSNLIQAFKRLESEQPNVKLLIAGDGPLREQLETEIEKLGLLGKVLLLGVKENIVEYYNIADCFVLSSAWEGFPMVVIEAMAMRLPIVTTECGKEALNDDRYVVPIHNSEMLFCKMKEIYKLSAEEREMLSQKNYHAVLKYDLNKICSSWNKIYLNNS